MGLLSFLSRQATRLVTQIQPIGSRAVYPDYNSDKLVKEAYCGNDAVYTIISYTSKKFASVPRYVYKDSQPVKAYRKELKYGSIKSIKKAFKSIGEVIEDSEYLRLMKRPNPGMGQDTFLQALYISKEVVGESFIWINRGESDVTGEARYKLKPLEIYPLPPQYVELIADDSDVWGVTGYILNANGLRMRLNKEDVIHWRTYNPNFDAVTRDHLRGFSPLTAGEKLLTANNASKDAMVAMFQNDGAKGVIFNETLDSMTPDQADTIRGVINKRVNNRDVKGAVATIQGKWGYIDLGKSSVDMQLLAAQDTSFSRMCNLYGVSPNLFLAGQTRDNLREARKDLITNKIMPDALSLDDELNRVLAKSFIGQELCTDFSSLPEMQYEMSEMSTVLKDMYDRGIINANEYREEMGWEETEIPEHQQYFVSANVVPIAEVAMPVLDGMDTNGGQ